MSGSIIDAGIPVFVDGESGAETAVIALIDANEFASAQVAIAELNLYRDHQEWRETREGFQIGLAMAGVDVKLVPVALASFVAWRSQTGAPASEAALNAFAQTILRFRSPPAPSVRAVAGARRFDADATGVAALGAHGDDRRRSTHRRCSRARAAEPLRQVPHLSAPMRDFAEWSARVGAICEPSIGQYAPLTPEYRTDDFEN